MKKPPNSPTGREAVGLPPTQVFPPITAEARRLLKAWRDQSKIAQAWASEETRRLLQENPGAYAVMDEIVIPLYPDPHAETGRRLVTVREWANRPDDLVDEYAYWFSPIAEADGRDPWRLVEGIDAPANPGAYSYYDVLFVGAGFRTVTSGWPLYVTAKHYEVLKCGN